MRGQFGRREVTHHFFRVSLTKKHKAIRFQRKQGINFLKNLGVIPLNILNPLREGGGFHKKNLRKPGKHRKCGSLKTPPCR